MADIHRIVFSFHDEDEVEVKIGVDGVRKIDLNAVGNLIGVIMDVDDSVDSPIHGATHVELKLYPMSDIRSIWATEERERTSNIVS